MYIYIGVLFTTAHHAWTEAKTVRITSTLRDEKKIYRLKGPLFFASTTSFFKSFTPNTDPAETEIHFDSESATVSDYSGMEVLNKLVKFTQIPL